MTIAGVIAEYDPFHRGHAAHLAATRAAGATHIAVVMSGNFTQRGEPAMLSKEHRTAMALAGGADLVLELPLPWAMAPAEVFADGAVAVLHGLGCVDRLSFGSECGDAAALQALAAVTDTADYRMALRQALRSGRSYAAARQAAAAALCGEEAAALLSAPNNTLGLEYIRAAARQGANFSFFTVPRRGVPHDAEEAADGIASAGMLRRLVRSGRVNEAAEWMPAPAAELLQQAVGAGDAPADPARLDTALLARLRMMDAKELAGLPYISEGLDNRLRRAIRSAGSTRELLAELATRRYPPARLRRILWAAMLGIPADVPSRLPPYIRVLGMNARGREVLAAARPSLPMLSRTAQIKTLNGEGKDVFSLECRAADLYGLMLPIPRPCGAEQRFHLLCR